MGGTLSSAAGASDDTADVDAAFDSSSNTVNTTIERMMQNQTERTYRESMMAMTSGTSQPITFETYSIGGMDVVTREEAEMIGQQASKQATARVFDAMKNSPATRRKVGLR